MSFALRDYQLEAVQKTLEAWKQFDRVLGVAPTGSGKTRIFSALAKERLAHGKVLILADREELIDQAIHKLHRDEGIFADKEKAEYRADLRSQLVVGSVQTLMGTRRERFRPDHFSTVIHDESHKILSESHLSVVNYFGGAKVFGCTATPNRTDKRSLGEYFESIAFEFTLPDLMAKGWLAPIKTLTVPLSIDLTGVKNTAGDFDAKGLEDAIGPMLEGVVDTIIEHAADRKILAFLPLIATAKRFAEICNQKGLTANYVSGECPDRKEKLIAFSRGDFRILANSMLLTTGYDQPDVDCIVMLRPTQSWSLYVQCVGRGTRIFPGKEDLLLLDYLWLVEKHSLVKAADLIARDASEADRMSRIIEAAGGQASLDLGAVQEQAEEEREKEVRVAHDRELSLQRSLQRQVTKKSKLIDPVSFALDIHSQSLIDYEPTMKWEEKSPTPEQLRTIENYGFSAEIIKSRGHASAIIDTIFSRHKLKLATPKQVSWLIKTKHPNPHTASFKEASAWLDRMFNRAKV
jgi:superfamily II DNA or RNA helicase